MTWLFLFAYGCSGLAGLIYEVCWTRLLTLYIGHTTAAASAVVAAFLGGLAVGAGVGGRVTSRLTPRQSLIAYVALELFVALSAIALPFELTAITPILKWAYRNGEPGLLFPTVRLACCFLLVFLPATALGATFPAAIRWFGSRSNNPARSAGTLYAVNTCGAALGALIAGFMLIPAIGVSGATLVGVAGSVVAALSVAAIVLTNRAGEQPTTQPAVPLRPRKQRPATARATKSAADAAARGEAPDLRWLATSVLALSGFAALLHEIAWTRILALVLGPTIYALAATLAAVIAGVAAGSAAGTWLASRSRQPAGWLGVTLALSAVASSWTAALAGTRVPRIVAHEMASATLAFDQLLRQGTLLTSALIVPTAFCLGAAFPLALQIAGARSDDSSSRFGSIYAVNTIGAVSGSLLAGFVVIPWLGLQSTLAMVSACLIAATMLVFVWSATSTTLRVTAALAMVVAASVLTFGPSWDRELLASGPYLYAPYVPKDLDLETQLKSGALLYYRDGAGSTVSVKRLTGTTTLAVDGKVDASNRSDMLTQKLIAHLPLLVHNQPRDVAIIGLGSGVTLGSALTHPIARADVIEISPEVVDASALFVKENHHALDDPRTHLIIGDGRSHVLLSDRKYDVIISEPSNPWIAGVAALFTREFFLAARQRLAPGGVICQWAHTYNISDRDLRSIVATFTSVFSNVTLWLVGSDDLLLLASEDDLESRLENIQANWQRPGVAADLGEVAVAEPFSILSLFGGGPQELERYGKGATLLTDDRMALEFSGPRQLHTSSADANHEALVVLLAAGTGPTTIREARLHAGAAQWRQRAAMMFKSDAYSSAYDDYVRALTIDPDDQVSLDGLVRSAVLTGQAADALAWVKGLTANRPATAAQLIATSKLLAANNLPTDAREAAQQAAALLPVQPLALEQLASLASDAGNVADLDATLQRLQLIAPDRSGTLYYSAASAFIHAHPEEAVKLAEQSIAADPGFAPVYDLLGAAYTQLDQPAKAREAFEKSLSFDAHDSTAYTNLGLLALTAGNRSEAARYFSEALGLAPNSQVAREGLARSKN